MEGQRAQTQANIAGEAYKCRSGKYSNPGWTGSACNCHWRCFSKFSDDDRGKLLSHFNEMNTYQGRSEGGGGGGVRVTLESLL